MTLVSPTAMPLPPTPLAQVEPPTPNLLEPNVGLVFWTAVVFLAVLWILWKYAWGPITDALEEREERIDASMTKAERALEEARQIQAENEKNRREAEQEARQILREAREEAEQLREEEKQKTRREIQEMQEQARADIEREKQNALSELRAEVADLAVEAAGKIIDENLDENRQRRLVDDFIDDLPRN
jgi:F-type H+-transporting ATPase subunit b